MSHISTQHVLNLFDPLILFQADKWEQVSPSGTAPSARRSQRAEWDDAGGRLWISAGYDGSPSLSVV